MDQRGRSEAAVAGPGAWLDGPVPVAGSPGVVDGSRPAAELARVCRAVRRDIVAMTAEAASGHPGGSLSAVEVLVALYFGVLRHRPQEPRWADRDRFILSKGHATPVLYSVLARAGYFPVEELKSFRRIGGRLQGHSHMMTPGVEMAAGSLGMGLSFALGTALAGRLDGRRYHVFALLGDGECEEGQVWEAAMAASFYGADNVTAIVDRNGIQNDRFTEQVAALEPLADKWRSFGWRVLETDGHDLERVMECLRESREATGSPTAVIARTVKGRGVSFMENNPEFHGRPPSRAELAVALAELAD